MVGGTTWLLPAAAAVGEREMAISRWEDEEDEDINREEISRRDTNSSPIHFGRTYIPTLGENSWSKITVRTSFIAQRHR